MKDKPHSRRASSGALPSDVKIDPKQVFEALGESEAGKVIPHRWDEAIAARPEQPPYLETNALPEKCRVAGIAADHIPMLAQIVDEVARDPNLFALAWYLHWISFVAVDFRGPWEAPTLERRLGMRNGLFLLLLSLELPMRIAKLHRERGYPPEVTEDTQKHVAWNDAMHVAGTGTPGIYPRQFRWFWMHLRDSSVRLGRFEYEMREEWGEYYVVLRRDSDGTAIALVESGLRITDAGLFCPEDAPASSGWLTEREETPEAFTGYPIHPSGRVMRKKIRLPRPEWRRTPAMTGPERYSSEARLDMHVPFGGGMTWEASCESFRKADAFFRKYHSKQPVRLLTMNTWFLDPRVPELLGEESNLARFHRACYLVPRFPFSGLWFLFLRDATKESLDDLPTRTSVQRAIIAFLKRGGIWHGGEMFVLADDMANPREGFYLERFAAISREFGLKT